MTEWLAGHRVTLASAVRRDEIVGIGHVMDEVQSLIGRLRNPAAMVALGADLPRGVLFYGPPGVGKTLVARHLAASLGSDVPMFQVSADELSAERVRSMFAELGSLGSRSVLYIDEIDIVALHRSDPDHDSSTRATLVALLAALDGLTSTDDAVLVASSNRDPELLDPALMRSGRIGVRVAFDLPDEAERAKLFELFLSSRPTSGVEIERLAKLSNGLTPADIRAVVDDATGLALADDRDTTTHADLMRALRRGGDIDPAPEPDPIDWDWLRRVAIHEAGHVAVAVSLRGADWVESVSINRNGGHTSVGPPNPPADDLRDQLVVAQGGAAAEQAIYSAPVLSIRPDMAQATSLAWQLAQAGLLAGVAPVDHATEFRQVQASWSEPAARVVRRTLATARRRAERIVVRQVAAIEHFAGVLTADFIAREHGEPESRFEALSGGALRAAIEAAGFGQDARRTRKEPCPEAIPADASAVGPTSTALTEGGAPSDVPLVAAPTQPATASAARNGGNAA